MGQIYTFSRGCQENLPVITVEGGSLSRNVDSAERAIKLAGIPVYQRGKELMRPAENLLRDARGEIVETTCIVAVDATWLRDCLCQVANWQKWLKSEKSMVPCNPPAEVAETLLSRRGAGFPVIAGVSSTPIFRRDGTIVTAAGFDAQTGLFLANPIELPAMPEHPDKSDAMAALNKLLELLEEFPFDDPEPCKPGASQSVALSAVLTPMARAAIDVAPMHISRAPSAGTGKSYLWDVAAAIACGTTCPIISAGDTIAETEKRLGGRALMGSPLMSIDNVNGVLAGDLLCQMISEPVIGIRVLGELRICDVTNTYTLYATGNNVSVSGDLTRRTLICSLDAKCEQPSERAFIGTPVRAVLRDRGSYVAACLTILRAHALAGYPGGADLRAVVSFGDWSRVVRGALVWLGQADPCETIALAREEDPERQERAEFLRIMEGLFGIGQQNAATVAQMVQTARADDGLYDSEETRAHRQALRDAFVRFERHGVVNSRNVGRWLARFKNVIIDNHRLCCVTSHKQQSWYILT